jgi:hypothetical protein
MTTQVVTTDQRAGVYRSTTQESPLVIQAQPSGRFVLTWDVGPWLRRQGMDRGQSIHATRRVQPVEEPWETSAPSEGALALRRVDFARFALGVFGVADIIPATTTFDSSPTAVGIEATSGTRRLVGTLAVHPATRLPDRLVWRDRWHVYPPDTILGRISESGGGAGPGPVDAPELEITMTFADHRTVNGFTLPSRITTSAGGVVTEEMRFKTIEVNAVLRDDDRP